MMIWTATWDKLYRCRDGYWGEWLQEDIAPFLYIREIKTDDGAAWFRGSDSLIKYDGQFTVYKETTHPTVKSLNAIIPTAGEGIYFSYDPYLRYGFLAYTNCNWSSGVVEKDTDRFPDEPVCLAHDGRGNL